MNDAQTNAVIDDILENLKDRCGKADDELLNLISNSKIRILASKVGVKKIYSNDRNAMLTFNNELNDLTYKKLIGLIQEGSATVSYTHLTLPTKRIV